MASSIKVRTSIHEGLTTVRMIIRHPMHTGFGVDEESGELIPAHYIKSVNVFHDKRPVIQCDWSRAVSRNPYLSFIFEGAEAGDTLSIHWEDNMGKTDSAEVTIE